MFETTLEPVRLVIWDLDDTFWRGTLTEGGIDEYVQSHHDIVIALARRGIMSSICSKNDFESVKKYLIGKEIWQYFIFPSIDWQPKGRRIASIVNAVQLRPETIMFIDDNHGNRAEATVIVPGIQVENDAFIPYLLDDPRFIGKNDPNLSRLGQYQLLEQKKADEIDFEGDNKNFLKGCDVRIHIETDVAANIDRAIELINRTNQLNFTKSRLPENIEAAKAALQADIDHYYCQVGLVHVYDKYGDYGFTGFFMVTGFEAQLRTLKHFCFSCRTIGMGVEQWIYDRLGSPKLNVVGDVLGSVTTPVVDWIRSIAKPEDNHLDDFQSAAFDEIRLQGGCELTPLAHYLGLKFPAVSSRTNITKSGMHIRFDSSAYVASTLRWSVDELGPALAPFHYEPNDIVDTFFEAATGRTILIASFWSDIYLPHFERLSDPAIVTPLANHRWNFTSSLAFDEIESKQFADDEAMAIRAAAQTIAQDWKLTHVTKELCQGNFKTIFRKIPDNSKLILLMPSRVRRSLSGVLEERHEAVSYSEWIKEVVGQIDNIYLIYVDDFISDAADFEEWQEHLNRQVYYRIFSKVVEIIQ